MRWNNRTAVAAAILLLGLAGALAFRRSPPPRPQQIHEGPVLRQPGPQFLEEVLPPSDASTDRPQPAHSGKSAADRSSGLSPLASISALDRVSPAPAIEL